MIEKITIITSSGCPVCKKMKDTINNCIKSNGFNIRLHEIDSEDSSAVDFAIENGISDIPACLIGKTVFQGNSFSSRRMEQEIVKQGKL